jgi:hypothetical protein
MLVYYIRYINLFILNLSHYYTQIAIRVRRYREKKRIFFIIFSQSVLIAVCLILMTALQNQNESVQYNFFKNGENHCTLLEKICRFR